MVNELLLFIDGIFEDFFSSEEKILQHIQDNYIEGKIEIVPKNVISTVEYTPATYKLIKVKQKIKSKTVKKTKKGK